MSLPSLNPFNPPFEIWDERNPTAEEELELGPFAKVRTTKVGEIGDALSAAIHFAHVREDNRLADHIRDCVKNSAEHQSWRAEMPSKTPIGIASYQKSYKDCDLSVVTSELEEFGKELSQGQRLFHGGLWPGTTSIVTDRPLSTSLCPQVALRNAEYMAKAYDAGRLDLWVLRIAGPGLKAFAFKSAGTKLAHELEVLIAAGAKLSVISDKLVRPDYIAAKWGQPDKIIPVHVLEIDVS